MGGLLRFQALDWYPEDVEVDELPPELTTDSERENNNRNTRCVFTVTVFGRLEDGRTISLRLTGFAPFFYLRLEGVSRLQGKVTSSRVLDEVLEICPYFMRPELRSVGLKKKRNFFGFNERKEEDCFSILFDSMRCWRTVSSRLRKTGMMLGGRSHPFATFESQTEPMLKMFHSLGISSCGWLEVPEDGLCDSMFAGTDICAAVSYRDVRPVESLAMAPFSVGSFDIECFSASGVFPVAKKDYQLVANNMRDVYKSGVKNRVPSAAMPSLIQATLLLSLGLPLPPSLASLVREFPDAVLKERNLVTVETKDAHDEAEILRMFTAEDAKDVIKFVSGDVVYEQKRTSTEDAIAVLNRTLPGLRGDPIIQIGISYNRLNAPVHRRWIGVLGSVGEVEDAEAVPYETEADLIVGFAKHLKSEDPDILTGWNIFGFDIKYLYERSEELGVSSELMPNLSRYSYKPAEFIEKNLSSSALGDNFFYIIECPGRIVIDLMGEVKRDHKLDSYKLDNVALHFTGEKKHDVTPADIFRLHQGSAEDRAVVANYCVQDCVLCNSLMEKLKIYLNRSAMASLSSVPLQYVVMRGQGIKVQSLVANVCREENAIIRHLPPVEEREVLVVPGATVMDPARGFYGDVPVAVLDYASLYPSCILEFNICPSTLVLHPEAMSQADPDRWEFEEMDLRGRRVWFARAKTAADQGIIPKIEAKLLAARKATRKKIAHKTVRLVGGSLLHGTVVDDGDRIAVHGADGTSVDVARSDVSEVEDMYDEFQKAVLDSQQLNYKILANSVYGQMGAKTSAIYQPICAMAVTNAGRLKLAMADEFMSKHGGRTVYGDTDSVFVVFDSCGRGRQALEKVDALAEKLGNEFSQTLRKPQFLEYEKVFFPFLLINKKRYVGILHEPGLKKEGKLKSMGLETRRRDNAPVVRRTMNTFLDALMQENDLKKAVENVVAIIEDVALGNIDWDEYIVSKTLKGNYKLEPAHKILADRIAERDPGEAYQINDRVRFMCVSLKQNLARTKVLLSDKVEDPDYAKKHRLRPDSVYYIEQIRRPMLRLLEPLVEQLENTKCDAQFWTKAKAELEAKHGAETAQSKIEKMREEEVSRCIFDPVLSKADNRQKRQNHITSYFTAPASKKSKGE